MEPKCYELFVLVLLLSLLRLWLVTGLIQSLAYYPPSRWTKQLIPTSCFHVHSTDKPRLISAGGKNITLYCAPRDLIDCSNPDALALSYFFGFRDYTSEEYFVRGIQGC